MSEVQTFESFGLSEPVRRAIREHRRDRKEEQRAERAHHGEAPPFHSTPTVNVRPGAGRKIAVAAGTRATSSTPAVLAMLR